MTIQNLIARLEKATGPDRALWDDVNDHAWKAHWIDTARHLVNRTLIEQAFALPDGNLLIAVALTLMPAETNCHGYELEPGRVEAFVSRNYVNSGRWCKLGQHSTSPANALCIAALRARATGTQP